MAGYDYHTEENADGTVTVYDSDGNEIGDFDSYKDFEQSQEGPETSGSGSEEADSGESGDNSEADIGEHDAGGSADIGDAPTGDVEQGNEGAGDTGGIAQDEAAVSVTVENWPTDYATTAQLETVVSDLVVIQDHMQVVSASMTILVVLVAACFGVMAVATLIRSFENW